MAEVIGANSVNSKIVYNEFILMFFALLSVIVSLINYEFNFKKLTTFTIESACYTCFDGLLNLTTMIFNTFSTVIMLINIYFRYKLVLF